MRRTLCLLVALSACDRGQPRDSAPPPPLPPGEGDKPAAAAAPAGTCVPTPELPLRYPQPKRLVAVGDVHGDLSATRAALRAAGAIDGEDRWIGKDLVVVQTGDVLDRGDDEQAIMDLFDRLEDDAAAAGGAFIVLIGNHELMNAAGDFRYVTPGGMRDFDDVPGVDGAKWPNVPEAARTRFAALAPGGKYAAWYAKHAVIAIVGDAVFSHAGVVGDFVTQVAEINRSARCWLAGNEGGPQQPPLSLTSDDSPVWTREWGSGSANCDALAMTLKSLDAKQMIVGHTVQDDGITSDCNGALWRIDVGLAKNYGGPIQVLEVYPGPPKVLTGTR